MAIVLLPHIGVPNSSLSCALVRNYSDKVVGSFWIMNGYGFEEDEVPNRQTPVSWIDLVLEENQAQAILDYAKSHEISGHSSLLYLGYSILVVAGVDNPANLSFIVEHVRMDAEAERLLKELAERNLPAYTEVLYPEWYADMLPNIPKDLRMWTVQIWEDYCTKLLAQHGQKMLKDFFER
jgi:hypothetical protein